MNIAAMYKYLFLLFLFINYGYACISSGVSMAQEKLISHFICGKVYVSGGFDKVFGGIIVVGIDKISTLSPVSTVQSICSQFPPILPKTKLSIVHY